MQVNNKFRYKLFKISLLLFIVQIVFTIPLLYGSPKLTLDDFVKLAQWDLFQELFGKILIPEHNFITTITCIPITIGLIISIKAVDHKFQNILLNIFIILIIIFEILVIFMHFIIVHLVGVPTF